MMARHLPPPALRRPLALVLALIAGTAPLHAQTPAQTPTAAPAAAAPTLAAVLASQVGTWTGKLEYRDYQADKWFGLPVTVTVRDGGDGVTLVRTADYDDGPRVGIVRITSMAMLGQDGTSEYSVSFRKGRTPELATAKLALTAFTDLAHWTVVATEAGSDDNRPATIRITTTRDGDRLTALKEVDFSDDAESTWLVRNRTVLVARPS